MSGGKNKKGLVGDLNSMPLSDVFQWASLSAKTGELFLQNENEEASIVFKNGKIAYATANQPNFLLGQLLITYKIISKNQLIKSLGQQKKSKKPLGQVLVDMSVIGNDKLREIINTQVQQIVYHVLCWKSGFFNFIDKQVSSNLHSFLDVDSVLMEGLKRYDEHKRILKVFNENSVLEKNGYSGELARLIDSKKTVREITAAAGGDWFETYQELFNGIQNGKIKVTGSSEPKNGDDPILEFLVALELFNKSKIYESYQIIKKLIDEDNVNEQIRKFYENLKIFVSRYFYRKYGGENSCFSINRAKLLDENVYISPTEGFILSRLQEYPCINMLEKSVNLDKMEVFLIVDKMYRLGLVLLKEKAKNQVELMNFGIVTGLLDVYKRELSGEMEIITEELSVKLIFKGGKLKFLYSTTEKFSLKNHIDSKSSFTINRDTYGKDAVDFVQHLIDDNGLTVSDLKPILEVYQTMVFYEMIKKKPISIMFYHDKVTAEILDTGLNLIYLTIFSVSNSNIELENHIDFSYDYEILKGKENIVKESGELKIVRILMDDFQEGILYRDKLKQYDKIKISILNILLSLGYLKAIENTEIGIDELENYFADIKDKDPYEIFDIDRNDVDLETIKQKYIKLTKKYHPDLFSASNYKKLAQDIFEIIKESYDFLLSDDREKQDSESSGLKIDAKKIFFAEQLVTSGKVYMNMGRLSDAIEAFKKAYENYPEDEEVIAYKALADIRSGKSREGFNILKNLDLEKIDEPELVIAYIEACVKIGEKRNASKMIDKAMVKYPEYLKRLTAYQNRLKNMG